MANWNQRLAQVCMERAITKTELARMCKVSVPTASDWMSGKIKNLEGTNLLAICDALSIDPWWLVLGIHKDKSPITKPKPPLSNEAKKLVSWVERIDGLGDPALKILGHIVAALQLADNVRQAHHKDVARELEEHERILAPHITPEGATKHVPRRSK
jgi:DNA-binding Xre family transcriptional regulator